MRKTISVAQLGCGYWGPNVLRSFRAQPNCHLKAVAEPNAERRQWVKENFPDIQCATNFDVLLEDESIEAILVATPAATHYDLTKRCLKAGKHVFVEKPMATNLTDARDLIQVAKTYKKTLMVGHTFLYSPGFKYLHDAIASGELGDIYYFNSQRLNLGKVRTDVNVWWNLAPHDVSMVLYAMKDELPISVMATGQAYIQEGIEDVVFATIKWANGVVAHIHVSWLEPEKVRKFTVVGSKKMAVFNDVIADKIKIFDMGVDVLTADGKPKSRWDYDRQNVHFHHRSGGVVMPHLQYSEPLLVEAAHFLDCVQNGTTPLTGPDHGARVVQVLEMGQRSLEENRTPMVYKRAG